jgi:hypothetical protein
LKITCLTLTGDDDDGNDEAPPPQDDGEDSMNEVHHAEHSSFRKSLFVNPLQIGAAVPPPPPKQPVAITFEKFKAIQR